MRADRLDPGTGQDAIHSLLQRLQSVTHPFPALGHTQNPGRYIDDPAAIGSEVRCIKDAPVMQQLRIAGAGQLVVRATRDGTDPKQRNADFIQNAAPLRWHSQSSRP